MVRNFRSNLFLHPEFPGGDISLSCLSIIWLNFSFTFSQKRIPLKVSALWVINNLVFGENIKNILLLDLQATRKSETQDLKHESMLRACLPPGVSVTLYMCPLNP